MMRRLPELCAVAILCIGMAPWQADAQTELRLIPGIRLHMGKSVVTAQIPCFVSSGHNGSRISVRNSTPYVLPAGARIDWRGKGGSGAIALATPLHPGNTLTTTDTYAVTDRCEAFINLPESPGLSQ